MHFARVLPIVGPLLAQRRVAVVGFPAAAPLVRYLAASGVGCWAWAAEPLERDALAQELRAQHGEALPLDVISLPRTGWAEAVDALAPDLLIVVGGGEGVGALGGRVPLLFASPPTRLAPCHALTLFPDDPLPALPPFPATALHGWETAAPLVASLARGVLLRDTPHARPDLASLWQEGGRWFTFGAPLDPFGVSVAPLAAGPEETLHPAPVFATPWRRRGALLVAGLGSLGSVAALALAGDVETMVIADPERVDAFNPVRQAYPVAAIGQPKAQALAHALHAAGVREVVALEEALTDERAVQALVAEHGIMAGLVVTGTSADFALSRGLRAGGVPHVVGRCYPRARYWEAMLIDGAHGPTLGDLRGHLLLGPTPALTPEQRAAYSDAGALEAEPATLIESGWAAAWLARLLVQLLAPPGLRERWFLDLAANAQPCLLGGIHTEETPDGPAYGIALPGAVRALGLGEIRRQVLGVGCWVLGAGERRG